MTKIDYRLNHYQRPVLCTPNNEKKLLLHTCCAPCSGEVMQALVASNIETVLYFYNPNIHPDAEYTIRKDENKRYADKLGMQFIDADYDKDNWFKRTEGQEDDPERGRRCSTCFDMRFEHTAQYAHDNDFLLISSTLAISRWKDFEQINHSGYGAVKAYANMEYWDLNWRKKGGSARMLEISKQENFYQQEYCGCVYSLRDTNRRHQSKGEPRIVRGVKFYR